MRQPLRSCVWAAGLALVGCGGDRDTPAHRDQESTANAVDCDVRYDALVIDRLSGIRIDEPTTLPISASERIRHLNELDSAPDAYLDALRAKRIPIELTGGTVTTFREFANLHGHVPSGWEGTGLTWDEVPGTGNAHGIFLGDSAYPNNAYSLAVHEGTHALDLATSLSAKSGDLAGLYAAELGRPTNETDANAAYRRSNIREFLAVAVDEFVCNARTRGDLEARYPEMFAYVRDRFPGEIVARSR